MHTGEIGGGLMFQERHVQRGLTNCDCSHNLRPKPSGPAQTYTESLRFPKFWVVVAYYSKLCGGERASESHTHHTLSQEHWNCQIPRNKCTLHTSVEQVLTLLLLITASSGILNISESESCRFLFLEKEKKIRVEVISKENSKNMWEPWLLYVWMVINFLRIVIMKR